MMTKAATVLGAPICVACPTHAGGDAPEIVRVPLITTVLPDKPKVGRVKVREIALAAGQRAGRHTHPGPVICYVVSGTILFQIEGQLAQRIEAGSAVYEPANTVIAHFDAVDGSSRFIANYLLGADQHDLITMI